MAEEKKKKCCVKSLKIIQQKRWAASVVQLNTGSQRSELKIIVDEEYPQSSKQTGGEMEPRAYLQASYQYFPLSNIFYMQLTHPSSP